jgi:HSP20 family protein
MADLIRRRPSILGAELSWPFRRLFEDWFQGGDWQGRSLPELWSEGRFVPAIDVSEDEDGVTLAAEVPGMQSDDLDVTVDNGVLTLKGEKKEEKTADEANFHRVERRYGHFERRIRLPDYVDTEKIDASYKDGVLTLRLPKAEMARAKTIEIKKG